MTSPPFEKQAGVYLHVPFCARKCNYCDFNSYAGMEWLAPRYGEALSREIQVWGRLVRGAGEKVAVPSVYFGGGTPVLLGHVRLAACLQAVQEDFDVAPDAEVTVETNPGLTGRTLLNHLCKNGFNRLSIGVQSFDDGELKLLGRIHSSADAKTVLHQAREAGFSNVNLDLMYGLPGQTVDAWRRTLDRALSLRPEHLSMYALTLEKGTPLAKAIEAGELPKPDPDCAAAMYEYAEDHATAGGYRHYEISNWALPGYECRHNLNYWNNGAYVGVGAGACGRPGSRRYTNLENPEQYVLAMERAAGAQDITGKAPSLNTGPAVSEVEDIDTRTAMAETAFLGLRLIDGLDLLTFERRFGCTFEQAYGKPLHELEALGLLERVAGRVRLTRRGRLLGNEVFCRFV